MSTDSTKEIPPALESWLDAATRGIGTLGKTHIRDEIGAHFGQAYEAALTEGVAPLTAEWKAIESLGSARAARRGFRRAYLTVRQERIVYQQTQDDGRRGSLALGGFFYLIGSAFLGLHLWFFDLRDEPGGFLMFGVSHIFLGMILLLRSERCSIDALQRRFMWLFTIFALHTVALSVIEVRYGPPAPLERPLSYGLPILAGIVACSIALYWKVLSRKMGKWITDEDLRRVYRGRVK